MQNWRFSRSVFTPLTVMAFMLLAVLQTSNVAAQCINTSSYGSATVNNTNTSPVQITTCNYATEYATITINSTGYFVFESSVSTDYITITDPNNNVVSHGPTPHIAKIDSVSSYRMHITLDASCNTSTGCRVTSVYYFPACISPSSYSSGTIGATNTAPVTFGTCWYAGEFAPLTVNDAATYEFSSGNSTDFLTLTDVNNVPVASGTTPLLVNIASGSYRLHVSADNNCTSQSSCRSLSGVALVPLCGAYTIDAGQAASSTNYQSFSAFASAISTLGVSCAVTVNVKEGTYSEQLNLAAIPGLSATNSLTIQADPANTNPVTLTYAPMGSSDNYTVNLNGLTDVSFNGITFESTGSSYSRIIQLGGSCANIEFDGNTFNGASASSSTTNQATFYYSSLVIDGLIITNNTFNNNSHQIYLVGSSSSPNDSLVVQGNTFNGFVGYGMYVGYFNRAWIMNNDFLGGASTGTQYGIYSYCGSTAPNSLAIIEENTIALNTTSTFYGIYTNYLVSTISNPSRIVNNMISNAATTGTGTRYGIYPYACTYLNIYHNTVSVLDGSATSGRSLYLNTTGTTYGNLDIRNNIFSNTGSGYAVEISSGAASGNYVSTMNNNLFNFTASNTSAYRYNNSNSADLLSWQTATTFDANSVEGDPIFVSTTDLHCLGALANNVGDNAVGVTVDIDGDTRPLAPATTVDIGADEFFAITNDLALIGGEIDRDLCYSSSDSVKFQVQNIIGAAKDFSVTPLVLTWNVTGAPNSNGTITVNSGTLAAGDTLTVSAGGVDLSVGGVTYVLNGYIGSSVSNESALNDTLMPVSLTVNKLLAAVPSYTQITNGVDTVELNAFSGFFPSAGFFITEVCHWASASTGAPVGGKPSWLIADDYIEVTGAPFSDLGGYTLEQWSSTALSYTYTFPSGTVLGANGTAIIAVGTLNGGTDDPANAYYNGSPAGSYGSTTSAGRILKDSQGNIVDAVGYSGSTTTAYTFPAAANVSAADWSNTLLGGGSSYGIRLEGADVNSGTNWVLSATSPQDPNTVNTNVTVPSAPAVTGFSWSLDGNTISTNTGIVVGPYTMNGTYKYVAAYNSTSCGMVYDTAVVEVAIPCLYPAPFMENFDGLALVSPYTALPTCWTPQVGPDYWDVTNDVTNTGHTYLPNIGDHTTGSSNYMWIDASSDITANEMETPMINISTLNTPYVGFWFASNNTNNNVNHTIALDVWDGAAWVNVTSERGNFSSWVEVADTLPSGIPAITKFKIYAIPDTGTTSSTYFYNDLGVDDFFVMEMPTCFAPTGFTAMANSSSSAMAYWTSTAGSFQVEYDTAGFALGMGNSMVLTNDSLSLSGLMANTNYQVYVRAICAPGDTSAWVGPMTFYTGYCTPAPTSVDGTGIINVTMGTINNSTGAEPGNYGDYTAQITNVVQGDSLDIDITYATGYTYDTWVWVDWNDDLDFFDAGEANYIGNSSSTNPTTISGKIAIPAMAAIGNHRIRIGGSDAGLGSTPPSNPCYSGSYGSFEDYTLNVIVPLNPFNLIDPADNATVLVAGPAQNAVAASWESSAAGATYEWRAYLPGGSVNNPLLALASDNSGMDTTLTFTIGQLDAVLASLGVNIGDTATIMWNVKAMFAGDSLFGTNAFTLNLVRLGVSQPNFVAAPVGGSGTTGLSAPNGTTATYFRAATIVTAAEYANANVSSGQPLRSVGFSLNAAASGSVTGIMKVYLLNTADASYLKGNIWDTIINDMVEVYNDTVTIAAGATDYHMVFSTNFNYSGNNVYVAYDWQQTSASLTTGLVYRANTLIASSIRRQASAVAPPATLTGTSSFRPELFWGVDKEADDLSITSLWAKGKNPTGFGTPEEVLVVVRNNGYLPASKMVTLNVSGANTSSTTAMVMLPSETDTTLVFNLSGANTGYNTITASVPSDDVSGNNSQTWIQEQTTDTYGYADTNTTGLSSVGYNTGSGLLLSRFEMNGSGVVKQVNVRIGNNAATAGNTVYGVLLDTSGAIIAQSPNFVVGAGDINTWVTFTLPVTKIFTNEAFFVGLAQTANATTGYFPVAFQAETPTRPMAYYTDDLTGGALGTVDGFRLLVEAVVDVPPTCVDPSNLAAVPSCTSADLSWVSDTNRLGSTIQWGLQGFTPGSGTIVSGASSPYNLTGLALGTTYDFWVIDSCISGTASNWVGPFSFTTDTLPNVSAAHIVTNVTLTDATVDFTATGAATSFDWDFGDGNNGTGATPSHSYTANGTYTVVLTATNNCGSSYDTISVVIQGIGIDEFGTGNIALYPNPNDGYFTVSGITAFGNEATLEVISVTGVVMYREVIVANANENLILDLRGYAPGVYHLRVSSKNGVGVKPFVIKD